MREYQHAHGSQWATIRSIAGKIGCTAETLRSWVRLAERDQGLHPGLTIDAHTRLKALARDARTVPGNEIPAQAVGVFCLRGARSPVHAMTGFIDDHRDVYGVESICKVLPIPPSMVYTPAARQTGRNRSVGMLHCESAARA